MPTISQLNALSDAVPDLNQRAAKAAQVQKATQIQQAIGSAPAQQTGVTRTAQGLAGNVVAEQAAPVIQAQQQIQQQLTNIGQVALGEQANKGATDLATQEQAAKANLAAQQNQLQLQQVNAEIAARKRVTGAEQAASKRLQNMGIEQDNKLQFMTLRQREQLSKLGGNVKSQILDSRLQFERDEMGRKFTNERQLADYNLLNAKTEVEFKDKMREMEQTATRKIQMLEIAEQRIRNALQQSFSSGEQLLDNQQKEKLLQLQISLKKQMQREQAKAANRAGMYQGAGMVIGAVVGGIVGSAAGPGGTVAGAAAGAQIGSGVGTMAASANN